MTVAAEGSKRLYTITDEGRAYLAANRSIADIVLARLSAVGERTTRMRRAADDERDRRRSLPPLVDAALAHLRDAVGKRLEGDADLEAQLGRNHRAAQRRICSASKSVDYTGTRTVARKPPIGASPSAMSPPCDRAMSRAMARPSPVPPSS